MKKKAVTVGFAGARWLGVECFKYLAKRKDVEIKAVCFPKKVEKVWWKDIVDEEEVKKLGFKIIEWEKWQNIRLDLAFSVLHGGIFKQRHLDNYKLGAINLHPAPLPEYRGCNSYAHAIMNGDRKYKVTMHYIESGVDTGPIIDQGVLPITSEDTGFSLYQKAQEVALEVFRKNLPAIIGQALNGSRVKAKHQDEKKANYYKRDSLYNKEVNLSWKSKDIINFVRALDFPPHEPAFTMLGGRKIYLTASNPRLF